MTQSLAQLKATLAELPVSELKALLTEVINASGHAEHSIVTIARDADGSVIITGSENIVGNNNNVVIHQGADTDTLKKIFQEILAAKPIITLDAMRQNFATVKANAGARYTPEIHVDLPESLAFEGLGKTDAFFDRIHRLYGQLCRKKSQAKSYNYLRQHYPSIVQRLEALRRSINDLAAILKKADNEDFSEINFPDISTLAEQAESDAYSCLTEIRNAKGSTDPSASTESQATTLMQSDRSVAPEARNEVSQLLDIVRKIHSFSTSISAAAADTKALLLMGHAGTGKTHLFCDVAERRLAKGLPTIMLLGQHFSQSEPWAQILQRLHLPFRGRDEFLSALDASAQASGRRALILIDALNEGEGKSLWRNELFGIIQVLEGYPRIGIAVSCRTSYERTIVPENLVPHSMVQLNHRGFSDHEYTATATFFDYYGIERPNVPLLVPEFSNPLFLKIFCQGLAKRNLTRIPKGLKGVTAIFNFFVDAAQEVLSRRLDYDPAENLVQQAIALVAKQMADTGKPWVERSNAKQLANSLLPGKGYQQSLFSNLINEGLLSEDLVYLPVESRDSDYQQIDIVKFPYERFGDHLIVQCLLDDHLAGEDLGTAFFTGSPLEGLIVEISQSWMKSGWLEALSIQVPERTHAELVEVLPSIKTRGVVKDAFLQSLIWRDPSKVTGATKEYLSEVYAEGNYVSSVYDLMLTIGTEPEHPFNAMFLHQHLSRLNMPERDQDWSIYLARRYGQESAVDRVISWAWDAEKSHISDESIELCAIMLAWFLTTSHRYARDRATKALVSMLHPKPKILVAVVDHFIGVDDLYVTERLCAVAYGVAMTSNDNQGVKELATKVYEWMFAHDKPPAHILLREYALGVIETANYRGLLSSEIDIEKARPPYQTEWLTNIPTQADLEPYRDETDEKGNHKWAPLYSSVMGFGDFARYIIGTNSRIFSWSSCRLGENGKAEILEIRKQQSQEFIDSLTQRQTQAWNRYSDTQLALEHLNRQSEEKQIEVIGEVLSKELWNEILLKEERRFRKTLGKKKQTILTEYVLPSIHDPQGYELDFDLSIAQRWIFKRVLNLGWEPERFNEFDSSVNRFSYSREANKVERVGKKYQWISYHEFLAYVSDNFEFIKDGFGDDASQYEGAWQVYGRDIDPSLLLRSLPDDSQASNSTTTWWNPIQYSFSETELEGQRAWITDTEDCPDPLKLLEVVRPTDGSTWLTLEGNYNWREQGPIEEDDYEGSRRNTWLQIRSYVVQQENAEELILWLQEQNFMGRWMPESGEMYEVFVGEFPWANPCTQYHRQEDTWAMGGNRLPVTISVTTTRYIKEDTSHDCSMDETISAQVPSAWLIQKMGLRWSSGNFRYVNSDSELVAFDPSIEESGPQVLLISKEKVINFLQDNKLVLLWTILSERLLTKNSEWDGSVESSGVYSLDDSAVGLCCTNIEKTD